MSTPPVSRKLNALNGFDALIPHDPQQMVAVVVVVV